MSALTATPRTAGAAEAAARFAATRRPTSTTP